MSPVLQKKEGGWKGQDRTLSHSIRSRGFQKYFNFFVFFCSSRKMKRSRSSTPRRRKKSSPSPSRVARKSKKVVSDDDVSSDEAARPTQFRSGPSQVSGQSGGSAASGSKLKLKKRKTPTPARDTDPVPSSQRASGWCHVSLITSLLPVVVCLLWHSCRDTRPST